MKPSPKIALVLGGGAARGYAHIGVIKVLEEELNFKPDMVVGCSMGSIVGGFYAYGYSYRDMEELASQMDLGKTLALLTPRPGLTGFIDGKHPLEFFQKMLGVDTKIQDLKMPYAAVAYELISRKEVIFSKGNLAYAMRASMSIPGVFPPLDFGEAILVDGGVIDPVPVAAAKLLGADRIIAVNVLPRYGIKLSLEDIDKFLTNNEKSGQFGKNRNFFQAFSALHMDLKRKMSINAAVIGMTAISVMESGIIDFNLMENPPDVIIDVDVPIKLHEFHKARQAIEAGKEATKKKIDEIKRLLTESDYPI